MFAQSFSGLNHSLKNKYSPSKVLIEEKVNTIDFRITFTN